MLNNQKINPEISKFLRELPYEMKVATFDSNCANCPFANYTVVTDTHFTHNIRRINCKDSISDAIHVAWKSDGRIERSCRYGGEKHTMEEVVINTCKFWDVHTVELEADDACFVEINREEEICLPSLTVLS